MIREIETNGKKEVILNDRGPKIHLSVKEVLNVNEISFLSRAMLMMRFDVTMCD